MEPEAEGVAIGGDAWAAFTGGVQQYLAFLKADPARLTVSADASSPVAAAQDLALAPGAQSDVGITLCLLAINTLEGATHHLLAAALVVQREPGREDAWLGAEAAARNCCEASARVAWLVDPAATSRERVPRALTASLGALPLDDRRMDKARTKLRDVADNLSLHVKLNKQGLPVWVDGAPPSRGALLETYLSQLFGSAAAAKLLWKRWSVATHTDPRAALSLPMLAGVPRLIVAAVTAAAGAHVLAAQQLYSYLGLWEATPLPRRVQVATAPMMLALLTLSRIP